MSILVSLRRENRTKAESDAFEPVHVVDSGVVPPHFRTRRPETCGRSPTDIEEAPRPHGQAYDIGT
jgi:hypothetical protein